MTLLGASVRSTLRVYWKQVRKHKLLLFGLMFFIFLANIMTLVKPLLLKRLFDVLGANPPGPALQAMLLHIISLFALAWLVQWAAYRLSGFLNNVFQPRIIVELENDAFEYLLGHSYRFFTNTFAGALVRKIHRLGRSFENIADQIGWQLSGIVVTIAGALAIFFWRDVRIGLVLVGWIIAFLVINILVSRWKLKYDTKRAEIDSERGGVLADAITNTATITQCNGQEFEKSLFGKISERWRKIQTLTWNLGNINDAIQGLLMIALEIGVLVFAAIAYSNGQLTIGDFALIQTVLVSLFDRLWDFGKVVRDLYEGFADAQEMVEILETPQEIVDAPHAKPLRVKEGMVVFDRVTFAYNERRTILKNFSLEINAREKVAFVGPSGAGKSTIAKLLMRFFDVTKGKITIDGQNIAAVTQESLRNTVSIVPQDPILFHRSLKENIRYGRRNASEADVMKAAKRANCHEFISRLPQGYDTLVGERGVKLSGGERQRIAIARAILRDAPLLVLDEATSSLDSESEALIQEALKELMRDKTVVVIAHRLSTIMLMDRIVVLENGKITDQGTHADLLKNRGTYARLWNIQAGGFQD